VLQGLLNHRLELSRFEPRLKAALVLQSFHNPAAKIPDIRVLNAPLGDFTAPLGSAAAIAEAVLSVQVRCRTASGPWSCATCY
jgi:hypothetical protein